MFQDLDNTLKKILDDPAMAAPPFQPPLTELFNADKSFITPDRNFAPAQPTVNLFLYEVKENRVLRNPVPTIQPQGNFFVHRTPPLRVDCKYLVTAWSNRTGAVGILDEHQLLAQTLLWLSRFSIIPAVYFQGTMVRQPEPPPVLVAQTDDETNAGQYWTALGISPRSAFHLIVTVSLDLHLEQDAYLVTTAITTYQQDTDPATAEEWIAIGGTVRDNAGQPVTGAWVRLEPTTLVMYSDEQGRFIFDRVRRAPNYMLRVVARGVGQTTRNVDVPSPTGEYNVQLP